MPHPLLWVGIILVGVGAGLVLFSEELTESGTKHAAPPKPAPAVAEAPPVPEANP